MTALVRFFRNGVIVASAEIVANTPLLDLAEMAGIEIPRSCTSGNCGTCICKVLSGSVPMPEPLPPGLDDYLVEESAILTCIGIPDGACDIELNPPL